MSSETSPARSRIVAIGSVTFVVGLVVVAAVLWSRRSTANKALADSGGELHKVLQAANEGKISSSQRDQAIEQSIRAQMNQQIDGYFKLPEGKPRKDYLDRLIDEEQKARKQIGPIDVRPEPTTSESGTPSPTGTTVTSKTTTTPDGKGQNMQVTIRKKGDASDLPPELRARIAEFAGAMAQRRAERGLPPGPGGIVIIKTQSETVTK